MAKVRNEKETEILEDDNFNAVMGNSDYDLDDDAFFDKYEPKRSRLRRKRSCQARRRLEEYRERQELKELLADFYDD